MHGNFCDHYGWESDALHGTKIKVQIFKTVNYRSGLREVSNLISICEMCRWTLVPQRILLQLNDLTFHDMYVFRGTKYLIFKLCTA
jgi:hypothetical protein